MVLLVVVIVNAQLYECECMIAHMLQCFLCLGVLFVVFGLLVVVCFYFVGEGIELGGDFYDLFVFCDGGWVVLIGDV